MTHPHAAVPRPGQGHASQVFSERVERTPMIVAFETLSLRTACEDPNVAAKAYGAAACTLLRARLADLRAAAGIADLLAGNPRIVGKFDQKLVIDIGTDYSTVWAANDPKHTVGPDGDMEWTSVTRVRLVAIDGSK